MQGIVITAIICGTILAIFLEGKVNNAKKLQTLWKDT